MTVKELLCSMYAGYAVMLVEGTSLGTPRYKTAVDDFVTHVRIGMNLRAQRCVAQIQPDPHSSYTKLTGESFIYMSK